MNNNVVNDKKIYANLEQFITYFLKHNYNKNMFNSDGSINHNYNSFKKTGVIVQIFEDHWNSFYNENKSIVNKYRPNAPHEIQKVIDCHNKNLGCNSHEDESYHEVTLSDFNFIKLILRHIIHREFKTIRSYGFYGKKLPFHNKINMLIKKEIRKFKNELLRHELSIIKSFNHSPYDCPNCSIRMNFLCLIT